MVFHVLKTTCETGSPVYLGHCLINFITNLIQCYQISKRINNLNSVLFFDNSTTNQHPIENLTMRLYI